MNGIKWEYTPHITTKNPIILKDLETKEPYLHYGKRRIKIADLTKLEGFETEKTYKLHCVAPDCNSKPWCIGVETPFGWQQASPWFFHKVYALNWCKRNNIKLS